MGVFASDANDLNRPVIDSSNYHRNAKEREGGRMYIINGAAENHETSAVSKNRLSVRHGRSLIITLSLNELLNHTTVTINRRSISHCYAIIATRN